jgi:D-sedoheptulose 7-phosphate isomerase
VSIEALYPSLYPSAEDPAAVFAEVVRSCRVKAEQIAELRAAAAGQHAANLTLAAAAVAARVRSGGRVLCFGNGGSSTDAQAVAALFAAHGVAALALTDEVAVVTALANDVGFDVVFARQVAALGGPGDVALALSTSGGSRNVLCGLERARRSGLLTVGFAGYDGGPMAASGVVDHLFVVPSESVHRIQEVQTTLYDVLVELVRDELTP